ncbi:MAG: hypothetical protein E7Z73_11030 [Methanobrevibacter millerae]|uniref:DUF4367 domain-containing protein n=1 Tax=Methanobrevibacter millerae TaxID=230361 RepID=A0A8T3VNC2_9EURY|nr:hypothetical protein [Methanobrevibacter millerae]MBE6506241.1 hypothetical protein [Methanobrevibacter millerae]
MEKKSLILLVVCILVFSFVALSYAGVFNHEESVKVGEVTFKLPEGYKYMGVNKYGYETASNGLDSVYFECHNDKNISKHIKVYKDDCDSKNKTYKTSNFTANGINVYKLVDSKNASRYWFVHDGKTYSFLTWKEVNKMDDIVKSLISSSIAKE